jgi:hypothetical protein
LVALGAAVLREETFLVALGADALRADTFDVTAEALLTEREAPFANAFEALALSARAAIITSVTSLLFMVVPPSWLGKAGAGAR